MKVSGEWTPQVVAELVHSKTGATPHQLQALGSLLGSVGGVLMKVGSRGFGWTIAEPFSELFSSS